MDKMKKYFIYVILIILFAIFTEFLINVGISSTYSQMEDTSNKKFANVEIYQAESTKVNGRLKGMIKNSEENPITEKYLKFDFYSDRGVNMGSKYIEIDRTKQEQLFEAFFKLKNVSNYKISFVNEKDSSKEIELIPKDLKKPEIIAASIVAILIFWA